MLVGGLLLHLLQMLLLHLLLLLLSLQLLLLLLLLLLPLLLPLLDHQQLLVDRLGSGWQQTRGGLMVAAVGEVVVGG